MTSGVRLKDNKEVLNVCKVGSHNVSLRDGKNLIQRVHAPLVFQSTECRALGKYRVCTEDRGGATFIHTVQLTVRMCAGQFFQVKFNGRKLFVCHCTTTMTIVEVCYVSLSRHDE